MKLVAYTDTRFNNLPDRGSQGRCIIFITNYQNRCSPIVWKLSKIKRVVRPILTAETLAINKGCKTAKIIEAILAINKSPIIAITDKKSLYQVANTLTPITDNKLLRADIAV